MQRFQNCFRFSDLAFLYRVTFYAYHTRSCENVTSQRKVGSEKTKTVSKLFLENFRAIKQSSSQQTKQKKIDT